MSANPWGAIVAALVAGFIAFIGMIISKENKTSEFRQAWIVELRGLLSKFLGLVDTLQLGGDFTNDDRSQARKEINVVIADIKLHLNHSNKSDGETKLTDAMNALNLNAKIGSDLEPFFKDFVSASHVVLKAEWERVKSGENNYLLIKKTLLYLSIILFGSVVIAAVLTLIKAVIG